nr:glutamate dehydrogenase [Parachlamydiaceae bacterium]
TPEARDTLENLGVLIIKDSSANKTGVICSSFEVLCGLALGDEKFLENKKILVKEILERLQVCATNEAKLLLRTHEKTGQNLTEITNEVSERINLYTDQLLNYLDAQPLDSNPTSPLMACFLDYCLPTLREHFQDELIKEIPEHHKKAIIACHLSSQLVYKRGLTWKPSIVDILPVILDFGRNSVGNHPN